MSTTLNISNASSNQNNMPCQIRDNRALDISVIVFFCAILLSSLIGNTVIIIIFYRRKDLKKTTNYFIANMAISDLIFPLTPIPLSIIGLETLPVSVSAGSIVCKLQIFFAGVSLTVSVESLVWIAVDRFIAVVFPIKVHRISTRFRRFAVTSTWIVALLICSVHLYTVEAIEVHGKIICIKRPDSSFYPTYGYVQLVVLNIAPLLLMTILYTAIAVTLRRQNKALAISATVIKNIQKKRQALKMSVCVMAAFYLLFIPNLIVVFFHKTLVEISCLLYSSIMIFASVTTSFSSITNPIICFVFVENYRLGLRELFNICHIKKSARSWKIGTGDRGEVSLQSIRVRCRDGRENLAKQVHIAVRGRQNERESILFSTVKTN